MPFYDYVCTSCGHQMEVVHSVHGHGPAACPKCGSPMKQAFSPPTVHYKGSGWARKDRAPGKSARPAPKDSDSTSNPESSGAPAAAPAEAPAEAARKDKD